MKNIAVIPARGGSKRLPGKNIRPFLGQPIILYSVSAAIECKLFEKVIVSSDDPAILELAKKAGADVQKRHANLAGDEVPIAEVCLAVLHGESANTYDNLCCLYATAALRTCDDILKAYQQLLVPEVDGVTAITSYGKNPLKALRLNKNDTLTPMWPEYARLQSQDLPSLWVDNGSLHWVKVPAFLREKNFYVEKMSGYPMPRNRSIDIDTLEDFQFAEWNAHQLGLVHKGEKP
jgi:pseudaminic acid cytidylyltransferase